MKIKSFKQFLNEFEIEGEHQESNNIEKLRNRCYEKSIPYRIYQIMDGSFKGQYCAVIHSTDQDVAYDICDDGYWFTDYDNCTILEMLSSECREELKRGGFLIFPY